MFTDMTEPKEPAPGRLSENVPIAATRGVTGGFIKRGGAQEGAYQVTVDKRQLSPAAKVELKPNETRGRRTKLVTLGLNKELIKRGDANYQACLHQAGKYRRKRMQELSYLHGTVSSGVGAMLAQASLAMAASRFLYQRAAEEGDAAMLKQAASLGDSARQNELAAYEMAAKEGGMKRRMDQASSGMPWLTESEDKPRAGRKTNEARRAQEMDVPERPVVDSDPGDP